VKFTTLVGLAFAITAFAQSAGKITVYRPHAKVAGIALKPSIYVDGKQVTRICNGCYFTTEVQPGKHFVNIGRSETGQFVDIKAESTTYFRVRGKKSTMLMTGAEPMVLDPVNQERAVSEMKKLKRADEIDEQMP
jgi:hypothetical protein